TARVRARRTARGIAEAHLAGKSFGAREGFTPGEAEQLPVQPQNLQPGELARKERRVGRVPDAVAGIEKLGIAAEEARFAGVGVEQPQRELHGSRLSCAVGTEQRDDLAAADREAEVVHRDDLRPARRAVDLAQAADLENGRGRVRGRVRGRGRRAHLPNTCCSVFPSRCGPAAPCTPAAWSAAILSCAVPFPPEMIAPACPIRFPGGAVAQAMNPTPGLRSLAWLQAA